MTDEGCGVPPYMAALSWDTGGSAGPGRVRQHPSNAPAATLPLRPEGASGLMVPCPRLSPHPRNAERFRATRNGGAR